MTARTAVLFSTLQFHWERDNGGNSSHLHSDFCKKKKYCSHNSSAPAIWHHLITEASARKESYMCLDVQTDGRTDDGEFNPPPFVMGWVWGTKSTWWNCSHQKLMK